MAMPCVVFSSLVPPNTLSNFIFYFSSIILTIIIMVYILHRSLIMEQLLFNVICLVDHTHM